MKKLYSIFVVVLMLMAGTAWAGDTVVIANVGSASSVNTIWNGTGGSFTLNGTMGNPVGALNPASTINVFNGGTAFSGSTNLVNAGDNPYSYGVNTTTSNIKAGFTGGGYAEFNETRNSSYAMYGAAGQTVSGYVGSTATGEMAMNVVTNFAAMGVGNYAKPTTTQGNQFEATGTFTVLHSVSDSSGTDGGMIQNIGTGTTRINAMSSDLAGSSFNFGAGQGCYTNATVAATGTGQLALTGVGANYLNAPGFGITLPGGGSFQTVANYGAGLNVTNFSINGN